MLNDDIQKMFLANKMWAESKTKINSDYFKNMTKGQSPKFLWIGCSDSRVPANEITGTDPGELFVHRNVANLVVHNDVNLMSVVQYSVENLLVDHIIVCGHTNCGGVKAAMEPINLGMMNKWLVHIRDVAFANKIELKQIANKEERYNRLIELNVIEQAKNLTRVYAIQKQWKARKAPYIHGWIYDLGSGYLKKLVGFTPENFKIDDEYIYDV